jgi:hypothetical protein
MIDERTKQHYLSLVQSYKLSPTVESFIEKYEELVGIRDRFLWKWGLVLCSSMLV